MLSHFFRIFIAVVFVALSQAQAQISTDGTLGPAGTLISPDFRIEIKAELGKQVGGNLFHSFKEFNINTGERATFRGPNSVENIISRVTGGAESRIDGFLRSEIPGANLYLLNPSGVIFGKNAVLDIDGSFHVSTADYLRLKDSGRFDATQPEMSNLTAATPSAFGFLTDNPKGITTESKYLIANPGQTLSLIGGDIDIRGGVLAVESGRIDIGSTASPGEIIPGDSGLEIISSGLQGNISMSEGAQINVSGRSSSGNIFIRGGQFEIRGEGTSLLSKIENGKGGNIDIRMSGDMAVREGAVISTSIFGRGKGGDISLNIKKLDISSGGNIDTSSKNTGIGGNILITADESVTISGKGVLPSNLDASSYRDGDSGNISVTTNSLTVSYGGLIQSITMGNGAGGDILLNANHSELTQGGRVIVNNLGAGKGGNISMTVRDSLLISEYGSSSSPAGLYANAVGIGNAGDIAVSGGTLILSDNGVISASTFGKGDGGYVSIAANRFELNSGGSIFTDTYAAGHGGNIDVTSQYLNISEGKLTAQSGKDGGNAGNIAIHADSVTISDKGLITNGTSGKGNGGNISIETDRLELDRGYISSTSEAKEAENSGHGGDISITASDSIRIAGSGQNDKGTYAKYYGIYAQTQGEGNGGSITIKSDSLTVTRDAMINGQTYGSGKGGDVTLEVARLEVSQGGVITTSTRGAGNSGNISVTAKESVSIYGAGVKIEKGSTIYSATHSSGSGGNLAISAPVLMLRDKGRILAGTVLSDDPEEKSIQPEGPGGYIRLDIGGLEMSGNASISSESDGTGEAGFIGINAVEAWLTDNSRITTDAKFSGGGRIEIDIQDSLRLSDSEITTSVREGTGNGGDIRIGNTAINPEFVILNHGNISANADAGDGGAIFIAAENYFRSSDSLTQASSKRGNEGRVRIETPDIDLSGSLTLLPENLLDVSRWLKTPCSQRSGEKASSFVIKGHDALPSPLDDWLSAPLFWK